MNMNDSTSEANVAEAGSAYIWLSSALIFLMAATLGWVAIFPLTQPEEYAVLVTTDSVRDMKMASSYTVLEQSSHDEVRYFHDRSAAR